MTERADIDLPALFEQADIRAERIVATIRLLIGAALFTFLVMTLPNPLRIFMPATEGAFVPGRLIGQDVLALITIGAYTALGAVSLIMNLRGVYRPWMAWPFATLDALIALLSLWLGLLNTGMTGALAPLIPASWLIVIVLAFGTLRYNAALQVWLTGLIAVGLLAILWNTDGFLGPTWLTESQHPGSVFMITPPTVMRVFMLTAAGIVMSIAVLRGRRLVRQAVADAARRDNLSRYLPRELSDLLADGNAATLRRGRRDPVAVLFVDLRGFTALSESLDPAAVSGLLTRFRQIVTQASRARRGIVDKFAGDGAMVVFGMDHPRGSDAADAIAAATAIRVAIEAWSAEPSTGPAALRVAMGLHWGEAFCGAVGDEERLEYTVLGDVVNVASRLESVAKTRDAALVVSRAVLDRAGDDPETWQALGETALRGHSAMDLYTPA